MPELYSDVIFWEASADKVLAVVKTGNFKLKAFDKENTNFWSLKYRSLKTLKSHF